MEHSRQFRFEIRGRIGNLLDRRWLSVNLDRRRRLTLVLQRILRHNLRNDLNVVRGFADQLHREADNEVAERIVTKTDRLIALAEKARELEGIVTDRQARTETDLADLLGQVVEHLRELHPDVGFSLDCSDLDNPVSLRPSFERALQELLENAAKHGTGRHGIDVSARQSASTTTVEIRDDGPGLSDAERRILESGVEGNLSHGQGLGHWLVYWVVTNHDGTITTDVTDQGTTISVTVPTTPSDRE